VEAFQERDGFEILVAAVTVRYPFARLPAVVEIKHRCDGIDAQPVDVIAVEPEKRAVEQEFRDFDAAVIVDQRVPVAVQPLPRIGVLVELAAVEFGKAVRIVGEMPRHPVEQNADPGLMASVDEELKIAWAAEPAGWCEKSGRLISPRAIERKFGDRQQLDMGK